jgi:predicted permease
MLQEIRYALRMIARSPGFTAIAVLSLALGIGANAAIFSLADALVLRPLPVTDPGRVMAISTDPSAEDVGGVSYPDYRDLRDQTKSFDGLVAFQLSTFSMARTRDEAARMRMGMLVSDNFFQTLGVQPVLGRGFRPEEGQKAAGDPVVVLGHDFWNDQFNHDAGVIGRTVRVAGMDFTVIGVAPKSFTGMDQYIRPSFYIPLVMSQRVNASDKDPLEDRHDYSLNVEGRLKPGVSQRQALSELDTLWKSLQQQYPAADRKRSMAVRTQFEARVASEPYDPILAALLMALASLVLIIACANVANLLLSRARGRSREIAVRIALGVSRGRLLRQLLIENFVLSMIGAGVGLIFAFGGIRFLGTFPVPTDLPVVIAPQLDQRVLFVSLMAALASVLIFGLAPALQSLKIELVSALKSGDSGGSQKRRTLGRNTLVAGQIALAMVLLVAAGMLLDGFRKTLIAGPGFRTDHLMMMEFDTALVHYKPEQTLAFYRDLTQRARALPGVTSVALVGYVPFSTSVTSRPVVPEGYEFPKGRESDQVFSTVIDEHYLEEMGIPIVNGREFTANDKFDAPHVAIVNQEFARRYWPGQEPLGKRFHLKNAQGPLVQVVGVARNSKYTFIGEPQQSYFYLPYAQEPHSQMVLLAQTQGDPAAVATPLRDIAHALDANQPIYNVRTLSNFIQLRAVAAPMMIMQIVGVMGLMGLALALIGIYGLVSYSVARRTREIGVRMAIGADRSDVIKMVLRQGFILSLAGIAAGAAISLAVAKAIAAGFVGLGKPNVTTFIVVPIAVLAVTMFACWAPARRASRVDPIQALRFE